VKTSSSGFSNYTSQQWGTVGDFPAPGDYDGDGKLDFAVYRPSEGNWYILRSGSGFTAYEVHPWGTTGDIPVPGDYNGDGRTDCAVYRPSEGNWYLLPSGGGTWFGTIWGTTGDIPLERAAWSHLLNVNGGIYYVNDQQHYCYYPSWGTFTGLTSMSSVQGIPTLPQLPAGLSNDGPCHPSNQLFNINGGIYFENASNHFCSFSDWQSFVSITGRTSVDGIMLIDLIPPGAIYDGACT
jgi:hypothetical protein